MQQLSVRELHVWLSDPARDDPLMLDVREPHEWQFCHIEGSVHMPMRSVPARLEELDRDAPIVCVCHHGGRSMQVAMFLERAGFAKLYNLQGGVNAWAGEIDPAMPRY